jgi:hypothetical protein
MQSGQLTVETGDGLPVSIARVDVVLSLADGRLLVALAAVVIAVVGTAAVAKYRSAASADGSDDRSSGDPTGSESEPVSTHVSFEEQIGEATLKRLEPIVPDAVARVRERASVDTETGQEELDRAERELRHGLEDALADGRFDMALSTPDGDIYEIVNLPGRYREFPLPPSGRTIRVDEAEDVVRGQLEDGSLRNAAMAAAAVRDHREEISEYVRRHETEIVELRRDIDETLDDVYQLVERLDGALADRVGEFVQDGRHGDVVGVAEIERSRSDANYLLRRCSFEDARQELHDARENADDLLVTVDFLGGLIGTIEHGSGTVPIPTAVSTALVTDLAPIIERQYDVDATVDGKRIAITDRNASSDEGGRSKEADGTAHTDDETAARDSTGSTARAGNRRVRVESVADEILYVLRELNAGTDGDTVQYQTERLPDGIAQPSVLEELAAFCGRQTDIVATVDLQDGAPPGFLELEFTDRTTPRSGLETIRKRFVERYAS